MKFKNFFAQHKRTIAVWGILLAIFCIAASPAFQTFNTDQFGTAGSTTVAIKADAGLTNTHFSGGSVTFPSGQKFLNIISTGAVAVTDGSVNYQMNNISGDYLLTGPGGIIMTVTQALAQVWFNFPIFGNGYGISNFLTLASNNVVSTTNARTLRFWNAANVSNANGVVDVVLNSGGGGGGGINTNGGSGTNNSFVGMLSSNTTLAGSYLYTNVTATTNIDWAFMSQTLSLNSNTTFTCSNTNLASEVQVQVANTASSNITITLPSNVILTALQSNAPIVLSANTTNFLYFMRDANNKLWLTVNGPSTAATSSGSGGLTFEDFKIGNNIIWDDFQESSGSGSATWGPFHFIRNNGGTGAIGDAAGTTNAPGLLRMSTGITAGSWVAYYNYSSAATAPYLIRGNWTNRIRFRLNALQNPGTATYRFVCGYGNSTSASEPTEGGYLRYDTNDTHFVYITTSGGGTLRTTNATTLTPVATTWYEYISAFNITGTSTNVVFWIDGANSVTYTASNSIPSGAVVGLHHNLSLLTGTTSITADVDYDGLKPLLPVTR